MNKPDNMEKAEIAKKLDDDIFFALFRKGAYKYLEDMSPCDPSDPGDSLSGDSEKRIMHLIKKEIRREKAADIMRKSIKVAVIVLIVIALSAVTIVSVEAFRVPVFNLFINSSDESTDVSVVTDAPDTADQAYLANSVYMPAGYELTATEEYSETTKYVYSNAEGANIVINRYSLGSNYVIDTESEETGRVDINGFEGLYSIKNGIIMLSFRNEEYAYLIHASIELPEAVKIAESIR